jgi:hypothetical protein
MKFSLLAFLVSTSITLGLTTVALADALPPPITGEGSSAPTCVVVAKPNFLKLGESLTLTVITTGDISAVTLDGSPISFPLGQRLFTPTTAGTYIANVAVKGPGGSSVCASQYQVVVNGCKKGHYELKTYSEPVIRYKKKNYYEYRCDDAR